MPNPPALRIEPLGDAALLATVAEGSTDARQQVHGLAAACQRNRLPGVTDIVPAFNTVGVFFDPADVALDQSGSPSATVTEWLRACCVTIDSHEETSPRLVEIPVCYGGEFGPDLDTIAHAAGIDTKEAIRRHRDAEYHVGAIGFAPGFAYLEGLPSELHTSRQATPRTRVPAGSVAIGGRYTGVYPRESPGGWNLIGRTSAPLFDTLRDPPSLLQTGDHVRFIPVGTLPPLQEPAPGSRHRVASGTPLLRVLSPGVQASLQGMGGPGMQAIGVCPSGAMDPHSLQLANLLAGAPRDALTIEATLVGPVLEAQMKVTLGLAGALPPEVGNPKRLILKAGQRIDLRQLAGGARLYIATAGGFASDETLMMESRHLEERDVLYRKAEKTPHTLKNLSAARPSMGESAEDGAVVLRVLPGPQRTWFDEASWSRFLQAEYQISPQSNRMGLRCEGPTLRRLDTREMESQPVTHGAIQVPPNGQPVLLGVDRQTLGGYPVLGCVVTADLPKLGQLGPASSVRFREATLEEAEKLRQEEERSLAIAATGIALHDQSQ